MILDAEEYDKKEEAKRLSSKGKEVKLPGGIGGSVGGKVVFKDGWMPVGGTITADGKAIEGVDDAQDALLEKISAKKLLEEGSKLATEAAPALLDKIGDKAVSLAKDKAKKILKKGGKSVGKGYDLFMQMTRSDWNCTNTDLKGSTSGSASGSGSSLTEDKISKASSVLDDDSSAHTPLEREQKVLERSGEKTAESAVAREDELTAAHSVVEDDKNTEAMVARTPLEREQRSLENDALVIEEREMSTGVELGAGADE